MTKSPPADLSQIAQTIFQDILANIIHTTVVSAHNEHKTLLSSLDPTTRLPHCQVCKLPRLLDPPLAPSVRGTTSDPPSGTNYCENKPWTRRAGHDIYGNPFLKSDVTGRPMTKKEKAEQAKSKKDANDNDDGDGSGSPSQDTGPAHKLEKGEKKASKIDEKLRKGEYIPWHTCPNCKRSLLITRFAKHLEGCMNLNGRAARRDALAKMNGSAAGGSTPAGSRVGTPAPGGDAAGDEDGEDEIAAGGSDRKGGASGAAGGGASGSIKKKLLKKSLHLKAKKDGSNGTGNSTPTPSNGKLSKKDPPRARPANPASSPAPSSAVGEGKRDRDELDGGEDDDGDAVHVKKRQKLQRVGSTASFASQGTATTAPEMERGDSNDGSFVESFGGED